MLVPSRSMTAIGIIIGLQIACAAKPPLVTPVSPQDSIPESEIRQEMQSVRSGIPYPLLFFLVGGVVGCQVGGAIETGGWGDEGGITGCLVGGATGLAVGVVAGIKLAEKSQRAEAIRRIRARRAQRDSISR
jgi:hypothetical protein